MRYMIDEISLKNYRCFGAEQKARLAPLTLLVGENSTGKTSFLAMIRPLVMAAAFRFAEIDFKEDPYDLGIFDEMVYRGPDQLAEDVLVEAAFRASPAAEKGKQNIGQALRFSVGFGRNHSVPVPRRWQFELGELWVDYDSSQNGGQYLDFGVRDTSWRARVPRIVGGEGDLGEDAHLHSMYHWIPFILSMGPKEQVEIVYGKPPRPPTEEEWLELNGALWPYFASGPPSLFASAPVRSKPKRTYEPT